NGVRACSLERGRKPVDGAQHFVARRVLHRLEHVEADASERVTDDTNVIEGIGQRADAGLVVLVADDERNAFLCIGRSGNQRAQQRQKNCGSKSHGPHTLTAIDFARITLGLQPWRQLCGPTEGSVAGCVAPSLSGLTRLAVATLTGLDGWFGSRAAPAS